MFTVAWKIAPPLRERRGLSCAGGLPSQHTNLDAVLPLNRHLLQMKTVEAHCTDATARETSEMEPASAKGHGSNERCARTLTNAPPPRTATLLENVLDDRLHTGALPVSVTLSPIWDNDGS